jgi:large subunit ribosomal protein L49
MQLEDEDTNTTSILHQYEIPPKHILPSTNLVPTDTSLGRDEQIPPTTTFSQSPPPPSQSTPSTTSSQESTAPTIDRSTLAYHVSRTPTNNLPVYSEFKGHRTLKLTMVRKITGDSNILRNDLEKELGLDKKTCYVKLPAGHVYMKGQHKEKVLKFLTDRGF